jgi:hypothetical protein
MLVGPEFFGETAIHSNSNGQTGFEGLLTTRLERTGDRPHLRFRIGIGHGIVEHYGNNARHKSMVVESSAYRLCARSTPMGSFAVERSSDADQTCAKSAPPNKILEISNTGTEIGAVVAAKLRPEFILLRPMSFEPAVV